MTGVELDDMPSETARRDEELPTEPAEARGTAGPRRPHALPDQACGRRVRPRLRRHHRPARDARHHGAAGRQRRRRPQRRDRHRPARPRRPQRRGACRRHQDRLALWRAAQHHRPRRSGRGDRRRASRARTSRRSASGSPATPASSGSSARSRRSQQAKIHALGIPGHRLPHREPALLSRRTDRGARRSAWSISTTRASPASRNTSTIKWLADLHAAGFARGEDARPGQAVDRPPRAAHPPRRARRRRMERYHAIAAAGIVLNVHTGEVRGDGLAAGLRPQ